MQQFTPRTQRTLYSALPWVYPRNDEHQCTREGLITTTEKKCASRSHEQQPRTPQWASYRAKEEPKPSSEITFSSVGLLCSDLANSTQAAYRVRSWPRGAPAARAAARLGKLLKTSFREGKTVTYRDTHSSRKELCFGSTAPPVPLCSTRGARGHFVVQVVHEGVLEEEVEEEVGLWTQDLLARDELDGWPGLRP